MSADPVGQGSATRKRPDDIPNVPIYSARAGSHFNQNDNGFYVTCNVGSPSLNFLIDCGATTSLLSSSQFAELK